VQKHEPFVYLVPVVRRRLSQRAGVACGRLPAPETAETGR
jgi:hypothetical protein